MEALGLPLDYSRFWLAVWSSAAVGGFAYGIFTRRPVRGAGLALMTVPAWIAVWGFVNSIPALADGGSFVPARSTYRLSSSYIRTILIDIGYLGAGFLLWTAHQGWPRSARELARRLKDAGLPLGGRERASLVAGWFWFPVLLLGTIALDLFVRNQVPAIINGDETQVWRNMTIFHAIMISAAAAFTEELVYRGLVFLLLLHALRRVQGAQWYALVGQALLFGLAHGGYGTIYHVLGPLIFGLVAGFAAVRYGIWSAIALHFLVDFYVFGAYAAASQPWWLWVLWTLLVLNIAATLVTAVRWRTMKKESAQGEM